MSENIDEGKESVSGKSNNFFETHSTIVVDKLIHSTIVVDANSCVLPCDSSMMLRQCSEKDVPEDTELFEDHLLENRAYGIFNHYPPGIVNPAFSGMLLWELNPNHLLNEFEVNKFHAIKNGIIIHHTKIYVFTQIRNDDIQSHLKILLRGKKMKNNMSGNMAATTLRKYVRHHCKTTIIPSITSIQRALFNLLGITENSFLDDRTGYFTLLHRLYLLMFMLHYNMPLQRCRPPGERNSAKTIQAIKKKGWYSSLKPIEQEILQSPNLELASFLIPEDSLNGVTRISNIDYSQISSVDIENSMMYRDGTMDNMQFQYMIMKFQSKYATQKRNNPSLSQSITQDPKKLKPSLKQDCVNNHIKEVATINDLQQELSSQTSCTKIIDVGELPIGTLSWNGMFHDIISTCQLKRYFQPEALPTCYEKGSSCSHIFHIDMNRIISNTIHLTLLEQSKSADSHLKIPSYVVEYFVSSVMKQNPIWDIGLQFLTVQMNVDRMYTNLKDLAVGYTKHCVCPCSHLLRNWHKVKGIDKMPVFKECSSSVFSDPMDFVHHIQNTNGDFYHRLIMRLIQSSYSSLLAKFTTDENNPTKSLFHEVHKGIVTLPDYRNTGADYTTFKVLK